MQEFKLTIALPKGETRVVTVPEGTTLEAVAKQCQDAYDAPVILAKVGHKLRELNKVIKADGDIGFLTMTENDGKRTYRRGVTMLLQKAVENLYGPTGVNRTLVKVLYSLGQGYYCEFAKGRNRISDVRPVEEATVTGVTENATNGVNSSDETLGQITSEQLAQIKQEMLRLAAENLPIKKASFKSEEAEMMFDRQGMEEKERLLHYRRSSRVNLYELDGMMDYFYGYMAPSTGYLKWFDLVPYEEGFVLLFPNAVYDQVEPLETSAKLHHTLHESKEWSSSMGIGSVGELNDAISAGRGQNLILTCEAVMEQKIGNLAQTIVEHPSVKFVMIAGPSSSGKTSFANRLSIQLSAKGVHPYPISLDDYYADRELCPRNPDGSFDFECLEAIDVKQFNEDMSRLLSGERVEMPSFNFKTGKREYRGNSIQLGTNDILVIEGIHGLNDKLSYTLPAESKFRIYISALTQLNIDEHNPLSTTDGRLIRRMVRDARTRGTAAQQTIAMWPSVRNGEEKYIFPFQDSADVIFNSALIYELAVLKTYAEPLLFQIPRDAKEYSEAKRLLKFLDYFLPLPAEGISHNSLVREFVGGSCFNV